jgi:hypothetical protein
MDAQAVDMAPVTNVDMRSEVEMTVCRVASGEW